VFGNPTYALLSIAAIVVSALVWDRFFKHQDRATRDGRLVLVFLAALVGAFLGAKLAFLAAEGWHHRADWMALLSGRSVTGALMGGTLAAEFTKWRLGIATATGDAFAITVPLAVAIGRIGCVAAGCCQGIECEASWWTVNDSHGHARVPSAQIEMAFNLAFLGWSLAAARYGWFPTQRFNLYLVCYGAFRFLHEYWRDDHRWFESFGGYHASALALVALGIWMSNRRRRLNALAIGPDTGSALSTEHA
jgi:phosphatidylglycerol:prolipoprotein diacylglycerol transferase